MAAKYKVDPKTFNEYILTDIETYDVRFPTSDQSHGSDAMHKDPNHSCPYILLKFTNKNDGSQIVGHGLSFTIGRGSEIILSCWQSMFELVKGLSFQEIIENPLAFSHKLTSDTQMRWIGPETGVLGLCASAYNNAIFDLWSWCYNKPLWRFLCDMNTSDLVDKCMDFQYLTDVLNAGQVKMDLEKTKLTINKRINELYTDGYPLYVTAAGWIGYDDEKVEFLCKKYKEQGFNAFKMKVGISVENDIRRAKRVRKCIGNDCLLMMDCNQVWDVNTAIYWMKQLAFIKPYFIEEPTSPHDILGHATIKKELNKLDIGVATGEMCQNRIVFKQLLQAKAIDVAQPDSTRLNSVFEILPVLLMCKKFKVRVAFHAGAIGLGEMSRHYIMFDYCMVNFDTDLNDQMCENAQHFTDVFYDECKAVNGRYYPPESAGFVRMKMSAVKKYQYPNGPVWKTKLSRQRKSKL